MFLPVIEDVKQSSASGGMMRKMSSKTFFLLKLIVAIKRNTIIGSGTLIKNARI